MSRDVEFLVPHKYFEEYLDHTVETETHVWIWVQKYLLYQQQYYELTGYTPAHPHQEGQPLWWGLCDILYELEDHCSAETEPNADAIARLDAYHDVNYQEHKPHAPWFWAVGDHASRIQVCADFQRECNGR